MSLYIQLSWAEELLVLHRLREVARHGFIKPKKVPSGGMRDAGCGMRRAVGVQTCEGRIVGGTMQVRSDGWPSGVCRHGWITHR